MRRGETHCTLLSLGHSRLVLEDDEIVDGVDDRESALRTTGGVPDKAATSSLYRGRGDRLLPGAVMESTLFVCFV